MRYPITLTPGRRAGRDFAATLRMTRAPVAKTVTVEVPGAVMVLVPLLLAAFSGAGDLSAYNCDTGQTLTYIDGGGTLADYALDGAGAVQNVDYSITNGAVVGTVAPTTANYQHAATFTVTGGPTGGWIIDLIARKSASDTWLVEMYLEPDGAGGFLAFCTVSTDNYATTPYSSGAVPITLTTGVPQTAGFEVSSAGVVFKVNGATVASTTGLPDVLPDSCGFTNGVTGVGFAATVDTLLFSGTA